MRKTLEVTYPFIYFIPADVLSSTVGSFFVSFSDLRCSGDVIACISAFGFVTPDTVKKITNLLG